MKYIKGFDIFETPIYATIEGVEVELDHEMLRKIGYRALDDVIYEQNEALENVEVDTDEVKRSIFESIEVIIPEGGLPFKLGYKWVPVYENGSIVFKSVRAADGVGASENPIVFVESVKLVPNAFYIYDGKRYVYTSLKTGYAESWEAVEADMEEF